MSTPANVSNNEEVLVKPAKVVPLRPANMTFLDQRQVKHICIVPSGTTQSELLNSAFWTSVAGRLNQLDELTVIDEQRSFIATYLVIEASPIFTAVHPLTWHDLPGLVTDDSELLCNFSIEWSQSANAYQARRLSDSVILASAPSKQKCIDELLHHAAFDGSKK